jgi:phospholipid-translocating ATPase
VVETIENLRNAGINIWMLTGDKVETAICTSISSGIKHQNQNLMVIKDINDEVKMKMILEQYEKQSQASILIVDGISLECILSNQEDFFFKMGSKSAGVVCCRCSPTQKAKIAEGLRKHTNKIVAAVGDGGNDVGMIQVSDVGIGIEGKEGK